MRIAFRHTRDITFPQVWTVLCPCTRLALKMPNGVFMDQRATSNAARLHASQEVNTPFIKLDAAAAVPRPQRQGQEEAQA